MPVHRYNHGLAMARVSSPGPSDDALGKPVLENGVIAFCPSIRADIIHRYHIPSEKVNVVFNGVSSDFLKSYPKYEMRKKLALDEDCFLVLFVGRLIEGKGIIPLLKALGSLQI